MRAPAICEIAVVGTLVLAGSYGLSELMWGSPVLTVAFVVLSGVAGFATCRWRTRRAIRAWARSCSVELLNTRGRVCGDYRPSAWPDVEEFIVHVEDKAGKKRSIRLRVSSYLVGLLGHSVVEGGKAEASLPNMPHPQSGSSPDSAGRGKTVN